MPRQKQSHGFVAKLLGSHLAPVFVHRRHQQREQILASVGVPHLLSLIDDPVHQRIEELRLALGAAVRGSGPALRYFDGETCLAQRIAHQKIQRASHLQRFSRQRGSKKRSHSRLQGNGHHFLCDIAFLPVPPFADLHLRAFHHRRAVLVYAVALERRLRKPPLTPPEVPLADQQAFAQQTPGHIFRELALVKLALLNHVHLLDVVRMVQEDAGVRSDRYPDDVAILARDTLQRPERVAQHLQRHAQERQSSRPRWNAPSVGGWFVVHSDRPEVPRVRSPLCGTSYYLTLLHKSLQLRHRDGNQMIETSYLRLPMKRGRVGAFTRFR